MNNPAVHALPGTGTGNEVVMDTPHIVREVSVNRKTAHEAGERQRSGFIFIFRRF